MTKTILAGSLAAAFLAAPAFAADKVDCKRVEAAVADCKKANSTSAECKKAMADAEQCGKPAKKEKKGGC